MEAFVLKNHRFCLSIIGGILVAQIALSANLVAQNPGPSDPKPPVAPASANSEKPTGDQTAANPAKPVKDRKDAVNGVEPPIGYRVGADDELTISVWHEPELSQGVVVRPDGMITLPLINDVKVVGLTTEELQALLTEKLKTVVNEPQVTVIVKTIRNQRVFVMGAVGKQGSYPMGGNLTVLQLISQAGGLGPFAKVRSIYILRREDGKEVRIPVNYKKALAGKGDDPVLKTNDMVVVP
jgi:polysaccharide export outer membrane protein